MLPLVTRPGSLGLLLVAAACFVWPFWREWRKGSATRK
jgi:hypothetical protein